MRRGLYQWFGAAGAVFAASFALALLLPPLSVPAAMLVAWSGVVVLVSLIVGHAKHPVQWFSAPIRVATQAGATCLLLLLLLTRLHQLDPPIAVLLQLALASAMLAWLMSALIQWFPGPAHAPACVGRIMLVFALLALAPLWGGTTLDAFAPSGSGADVLIGISPTTYLAQAANWDYLRSDWFYRASPLGSLRFEYTHFWLSTLLLRLATLAVQFLDAVKRHLRPTTEKPHISTSAT